MTRAVLNKMIVYQQSNGFMTFRDAVYDAEGDLVGIGATPAFPRGLSLDDLQADLEEFMPGQESACPQGHARSLSRE